MNWLDSKLYRHAWWRKWRGLPEPVPLTTTMICNEALRILSKNASFAFIEREYQDDWCNKGVPRNVEIRRPVAYAPRVK